MDTLLSLLLVLGLVAANGFFVAAEFAVATARKTRLEAMAARGSRWAAAVVRALEDPNRFLSACQLGITMASLALGWIGEGTMAALLEAPLATVVPQGVAGVTAHTIAIPLAFALITFLHITLGEQVPKMIALQRGEATAVLSVRPTNWFGTAFGPFIWLLYRVTNLVLKVLGLRWEAELHQAYSLEDLKALIHSRRGAGTPTEDSERMAERALDFAGLLARQVMVPRTEMVAVSADMDLGRLRELMRRHQHSRYPVFEGTPDNIIGVLSAKRLVGAAPLSGLDGTDGFDVRAHMNLPLFIPEKMPAHLVLAAMKQHRSHLAIAVDEYGATAGIVSLRDILDRIAGEVQDEAELESPMVQWLSDGSALVEGLALLSDVEAELQMKVDDLDYDTIGGFVFGRLGRRPTVGDAVEAGEHRFTVEEMDGLRVSRVRVHRSEELRVKSEEC